MTSEQYRRISAPFRGARARWIPRVDRVLTAVTYLSYPLLLAYAWWRDGRIPWQALWVPASWLILVSLTRALLNRPRPYERMDIDPLIKKDTKGRAMPSRHAFSVWMIAVTAWWIWPPVGVLFGAVALLLCLTRVVGGVHDEWDVTVGALIGVGAGILGYWIL